MRNQLHCRTSWRPAFIIVGIASVFVVGGVGAPATASTGGVAQALAALFQPVNGLTLNAVASSADLEPAEAMLDGLAITTGNGGIGTNLATTPAEPTGDNHSPLASLSLPGVVELGPLTADTVRTIDAVEATSSVASSLVTLGSIGIVSTGLTQADTNISVAGGGSASASVADLVIGGAPFVLVPNVPINHDIFLDAPQVFTLIDQVIDVPLDEFDITSGFGTIDVSALAGTSAAPDGANAFGLGLHVSVDLHVSLVASDPDIEGVLELDVVGPLLNVRLATTTVAQPLPDPSTTTTTTSTVPGTTTTVPETTTTVPGTTTTEPGVTTTESVTTTSSPATTTTATTATTTSLPGVGQQLPQTGSAITLIVVWASVLLAAGASVAGLAFRRR